MTSAPAVPAWVGLVVALAVLANRWNGRDPGWYAALPRPAFQPPDLVFALMWPLSFVLLLAAGVPFVLGADGATAGAGLGLLAVSVGAALGWARLFYVPPHRLGPAAVCLVVAAALTWALVAVVLGSLAWAGVALVPYAAWLSVAAALAVAYARDERRRPGAPTPS